MEYRKYMKRVNDKIGEIKAADKIEEGPWWNIVVKELNEVSVECAKDLQDELGVMYKKPPRDGKPEYFLNLFEAPPSRLLALAVALAAWIGWITHEKGRGENIPHAFTSNGCQKMIEDAYTYGVDRSIKGDNLEEA